MYIHIYILTPSFSSACSLCLPPSSRYVARTSRLSVSRSARESRRPRRQEFDDDGIWVDGLTIFFLLYSFLLPLFLSFFLFDRYSSGMGVVEREQRTGCNELQSGEQISMRIRYRRCLVGYGGDSPFGIYRMARILLFFF